MSLHSESMTKPAACEVHGDYLAMHIRAGRYTGCARCSQEEADRRCQAQAEADRARRVEELLRLSGLAGRYLRATLDNFEATTAPQRKVLSTCQAYVENFMQDRPNLFLLGPVGSGKTHLASGIARGVIERHARSVRMLTARDIVRRLRATWARDACETEDQVLDDLSRTSLLVMDEAGVGFGTEAEQTQLFDVVDRRYQRELPIIVLSNLQPDQLKAAMGERLYDRLRDGAVSLACNWPSHRSPKQGGRP